MSITERLIYINSSIHKRQPSAGYVICQAGANEDMGSLVQRTRKKSLSLSLAVSSPITIFSTGYNIMLHSLWHGDIPVENAGSWKRPGSLPSKVLKARGTDLIPPTSRSHLGRKVAAVAKPGWGCTRPINNLSQEVRTKVEACIMSSPSIGCVLYFLLRVQLLKHNFKNKIIQNFKMPPQSIKPYV